MKTLVAIVASLMMLGFAHAQDYKLGALEIVHPWARATPAGAKVGGAYVKIVNTGTTPDRLVGGSTPAARRFEIHEMSMDQGVARMRPLKDGLEIKPGQTVELTPGSFHIMLVDIVAPLKEGDRIKGTLVFEKAGSVDVEFAISGMGATQGTMPPMDMGSHQH